MADKEKAKNARKRKKNEKPQKSFWRNLMLIGGASLLTLIIIVMLLSNFFDVPMLRRPSSLISNVMTPVQTFFTGAVNVVGNYFRTLKYRSNLEYEYEQALIKIEELQDRAIFADEYENRLAAFEDLQVEAGAHANMNPLTATVIGHDTGNYFTTLELNRGSRDGVADYMAVVSNGGLVGYTYNTTGTTCKVATVIDSDTTIPALMESTRDQGSVKGTFGINGEAACRMYYLPENHLPRTGDTVVTSGVGMPFPKGIPIGAVRESTRGMEDNKQYIVIQPIADFQHLEYVTVYRYIPSYAETASNSETVAAPTLVPLATARPIPPFADNAETSFEAGASDEPETVEDAVAVATAEPSPEPTQTPEATKGAAFTFYTDTPEPNLEYIRVTATPSGPTPSPSPTPSPTPVPTLSIDELMNSLEEDE